MKLFNLLNFKSKRAITLFSILFFSTFYAQSRDNKGFDYDVVENTIILIPTLNNIEKLCSISDIEIKNLLESYGYEEYQNNGYYTKEKNKFRIMKRKGSSNMIAFFWYTKDFPDYVYEELESKTISYLNDDGEKMYKSEKGNENIIIQATKEQNSDIAKYTLIAKKHIQQ